MILSECGAYRVSRADFAVLLRGFCELLLKTGVGNIEQLMDDFLVCFLSYDLKNGLEDLHSSNPAHVDLHAFEFSAENAVCERLLVLYGQVLITGRGLHVAMPETEGTTLYFWVMANKRDAFDQAQEDRIYEASVHAFNEDIVIIEGQQDRWNPAIPSIDVAAEQAALYAKQRVMTGAYATLTRRGVRPVACASSSVVIGRTASAPATASRSGSSNKATAVVGMAVVNHVR